MSRPPCQGGETGRCVVFRGWHHTSPYRHCPKNTRKHAPAASGKSGDLSPTKNAPRGKGRDGSKLLQKHKKRDTHRKTKLKQETPVKVQEPLKK